MKEIHFINNYTLKHCLSIVLPFSIIEVITDDIVSENFIYIVDY